METVEKVQYHAGLAITGCWKGSSRIRLYEELGWETLSDRRSNNRIFQIYKIISKSTLSYLKEKLPPHRHHFLDIHDPTGLRYIFQLRLGLSPLRSHKKKYGFIDTPSDICLCRLGTEDTRHFLFSCPFYATKRAIMISSVHEILLKNNLNYPTNFPTNELNLFLYGFPTISHVDNKSILMATINFIKNTNRFSLSFAPPPPSLVC